MRHGEGTHNIAHILDKNAHLTENGRLQVESTAKQLLEMGYNNDNISIVYVSPLVRTRETAEELVKAGLIDPSKIVYDERIVEPSSGLCEGKKAPDVPGDVWDLPYASLCESETLEELQQRVRAFYSDVSEELPEGHVLVVTHGCPSRELINLLTGEKIKLKTAEARAFNWVLP